jgi:hypothetical protein
MKFFAPQNSTTKDECTDFRTDAGDQANEKSPTRPLFPRRGVVRRAKKER